MELDDTDAAYLLESIARGDGLPILGAGCSVSSLNARREPVKTGLQLACALADRAALPYAGEKLVDVLSAVKGQILSDVQITTLLTQEYKGVTPAKELEQLFQYSWRRVYT
jgi:hypothetical protein